MGDRSEHRCDQGSYRITYLSRRIKTRRVTCSLVLPCLKIEFNRPLKWGTTIRIRCQMYRSAFKLPFIRIRNVRVVYPISGKTITRKTGTAIPISNARRRLVVFSKPPDIYTAIGILIQNWDSSEKATLCHSCIQLCRSAHQSRFLCCIFKRSGRDAYRADRPRCFKCRHTVRAETGNAANMPNSWLMVLDVDLRFCRADLLIYPIGH